MSTSTRRRVDRKKSKKPANKINGVLIIAIVSVLAIAAVIILVMANRKPADVGEFTTVDTREWPQANGKSIGPADATVVLREFSDFQCPICKRFHDTVQAQIIQDYVETGKVRFEYHHFIVIDGNVGGSESRRAAEASECASEQNRFWDYNEMLFANQLGEGVGSFTDDRLRAFAQAVNLDTTKFNACFNSRSTAKNVTADEAQANQLKLRGTPSLFVNDNQVDNPLDYAVVKAAIEAALNGANQ